MDGRGHLSVSRRWPEASWNQFCRKFGQWVGTLAIQLAEMSEDDMLPWLFYIMFILRSFLRELLIPKGLGVLLGGTGLIKG
jgi:hypothetical protein